MTQGVILTGCVERRPERDSGDRKAKEKLRCCPGQSVWMDAGDGRRGRICNAWDQAYAQGPGLADGLSVDGESKGEGHLGLGTEAGGWRRGDPAQALTLNLTGAWTPNTAGSFGRKFSQDLN